MKILLYPIALALLLLVSATEQTAAQQVTDFQKALDEATEAVGDHRRFEEKIAFLLTLFPQAPDGYYIVDGDIAMTDVEIKQMVRDRQAELKGAKAWPDSARQGELIVITVGGLPSCYRTDAQRRLTYAVDKNSFASAPKPDAYQNIITELDEATDDWERACPECNIKFERLPITSPVQGEANFIVKYIGNQGSLIARAFFPLDPPSKRYVQITSGYYSGDYDRVGILRHELGHTLGYRHEHIRPEAPVNCAFSTESKKWVRINMGKYDKNSVMHYPCELSGQLAAGSYDFKLTTVDKASHTKFYVDICR